MKLLLIAALTALSSAAITKCKANTDADSTFCAANTLAQTSATVDCPTDPCAKANAADQAACCVKQCTASTAAAWLALGYKVDGTATAANVAGLGTVSCADNAFQTASGTAPAITCTTAGSAFDAPTGCTLCTCGTNAATCTCTGATAALTDITSCNAGFAFTAKVVGVAAADAVTYRAPDANACPAVTERAAVPEATAAAASCAATACSGEQTGCTTGTATNTANTCAAGGKLKCTGTMNNYRLDGTTGNVVACGTGSDDANAATWAAAASPWTACYPATCNAGWKLTGTGTSAACAANTCTAAAVPAGYTAGGVPAVAVVAAVTRACPSTCADSPPTGTCTAGVAGVTAADAIAASAATTVAGLGTLGCATGYTGTAAAACATDAGAFAFTGCTKGTAPASVAQTMIAFVLTVVAMYL